MKVVNKIKKPAGMCLQAGKGWWAFSHGHFKNQTAGSPSVVTFGKNVGLRQLCIVLFWGGLG